MPISIASEMAAPEDAAIQRAMMPDGPLLSDVVAVLSPATNGRATLSHA